MSVVSHAGSPASATASLEVLEIDSVDRFAELRAEWNDLVARCSDPSPALTHEWFTTWWKHYGAGSRLAIVVGRRGGRIQFALPLMETRQRLAGIPLRILRSVNNAYAFRYNLLAEAGQEREAMRAVWEHLHERRRSWDCLLLADIAQDSPGAQAALACAAEHGFPHGTWEGGPSPFIPVTGTFEAYQKGLKRKHISNLRNRTKQLSKLGGVTFPVLTRPSDKDIEDGLAIEAMGWKGESGVSILADPTNAGFFRDWIRTAAEKGWLRLTFLELDKKRIAVEFVIVHSSKVHPQKIGFDPAFSRYSPGQLLCAENIARSFTGEFGPGISELDFLGEFTRQKQDWTGQVRRIAWLYVFNRTLRGRLGRWAKFTLAPRARKWMERLRARKDAPDAPAQGGADQDAAPDEPAAQAPGAPSPQAPARNAPGST